VLYLLTESEAVTIRKLAVFIALLHQTLHVVEDVHALVFQFSAWGPHCVHQILSLRLAHEGRKRHLLFAQFAPDQVLEEPSQTALLL
jgi:hypothetical protein